MKMLVDLFGKKNADEGAVKVLMDATFDGRKAEFRAMVRVLKNLWINVVHSLPYLFM